MMTELDTARAVAAGSLPTPAKVKNSYLVQLRVSGSGCAWRAAHGEFCWREPSTWLSPEMLRRCIGLPVVIGHPPGDLLTLDYLQPHIIGITIFTFVRDNELWAVARIFDQGIADRICDAEGFEVDTSPAVAFAPGSVGTIELSGGERLLVEPVPTLIDHLALIITPLGQAGGVWSKGEPGAGAEQELSEVEG